jgi:hypothetical protein
MFIAAAMTFALVLAQVGCDAGAEIADEATGQPTPTLRAPSPVPLEAAERAALDAYRGMWAAYGAAGGPPEADPQDARLAQYATDRALQVLVNGLTSMREDGLIIEGDARLFPEVTELTPEPSPTHARIEDCADSTESSLVRTDGEPYEDEPGGRRLIIAEVQHMGEEGWKVFDFAVLGVGSCSG